MVEQRPFKALVASSSLARPIRAMAFVYILRGATRHYIGATDNLQRRLSEHERGSNHTTHRLRAKPFLVAAKEVPSMKEARILERLLKGKKNPALAIFILNQQ